MDPFSPINGISLERYAELGADVADHFNDKEACARIVAEKGVSRADWEAAVAGWTARMQDMALMGRVATAYMPLYQAALEKKKGKVDVSFEDFVAMSAARKAYGTERANATYGIDETAWTQIAGAWTMTRIPQNPGQYGMYGMLVEQEAARLSQGGAPKPVNITRQAGGAGAAAAPAQPSAPNAQQVENQMMAQAVHQQIGNLQAHAAAQAAAAYGNAAANMGMLGRGALGVMGMGSIARGIGPGMNVFVQWSDGNRYPGRVTQVGGGQVCVAFSDGRQMWVPETAVSQQ
jgi:hypothetical protein